MKCTQYFSFLKQRPDRAIIKDEKGNLVSMTIEHAKEKAGMSEVSFLQMEHGSSDLRVVQAPAP